MNWQPFFFLVAYLVYLVYFEAILIILFNAFKKEIEDIPLKVGELPQTTLGIYHTMAVWFVMYSAV